MADDKGDRPPRNSPLFEAHSGNPVSVCATFGGQGHNNLHVLDDLAELLRRHPDSTAFLHLTEIAASVCLSLAAEPHHSQFHANETFDLRCWLGDPSTAPPRERLALAPFSFPLNTLFSLAHYCLLCEDINLDPGQLRFRLSQVLGHSQGVFAAAVAVTSSSWASFFESAALFLRVSFLVGLESHSLSYGGFCTASAVNDCAEHGEGRPSPMLSISGLDKGTVSGLVNGINRDLNDSRYAIVLALINSARRLVVVGPESTLWSLCHAVRSISANPDADQSRVPFSKRKPKTDLSFQPVSAPFHSHHLEGVDSTVLEKLPHVAFDVSRLALLQDCLGDLSSEKRSNPREIIRQLIRYVTVKTLDWPAACLGSSATHFLDFGPGDVCKITNEIASGSGARVIQLSTQGPARPHGLSTYADLFTEDILHNSPSWQQRHGPRLVQSHEGPLLRTRMTDVMGMPPIMVAGMTPTTVHPDFVASILRAGFHVEIAGGGYSDEQKFEAALRSLAAEIEPGHSITCNLLYANPKTIAWQTSLVRRLITQGVPIAGITIGAGVPSLDVATGYITTLGIRHISFKPGSAQAIHQVIAIAKEHPEFPIGLQWTGGRAGGHHSYEDFKSPIASTYAEIRACNNIFLVAGSGIGEASEALQYLDGTWSRSHGYHPMPFDGILLGSRVMVAKEAHTSLQAKQLIVDAQGTDDASWHRSFDGVIGGVTTINSEMGQPIHMLATRAVLLWKELDESVFSIKDKSKRLAYLANHRDSIRDRLNKDYARPWFSVSEQGTNVELEDLTYVAVLRRLCELMYVSKDKRWIDITYRKLVGHFVYLAEQRFGQWIGATSDEPRLILDAFVGLLGTDAEELLYPDDVTRLKALFGRPGQKPVPFIPALDDDFETWFKKDTLWQSEDVGSVVDQDAQRVCIIHGPVAARHSKVADEPVKDILDSFHRDLVQCLSLSSSEQVRVGRNLQDPQESTIQGVQTTIEGAVSRSQISKNLDPTQTAMLLRMLGVRLEWLRACLSEPSMYCGNKRVDNPLLSALQPRAGDLIETVSFEGSSRGSMTFTSAFLGPMAKRSVLILTSEDGRSIHARLQIPTALGHNVPELKFRMRVRSDATKTTLHEDVDQTSDQTRSVYACLWTNDTAGLPGDMHDGSDYVLTHESLVQFNNVIRQTSSPSCTSWQPDEGVPLDFCIVIAWKMLMRPLLAARGNIDFLRLLHQSISFRYLSGPNPLAVNDRLRTESQTTADVLRPNGRLIRVKAVIYREGVAVVEVVSEFFIVQPAVEHATQQFQLYEEPEMRVFVKSDLTRALLMSRKWLGFQDSTAVRLGSTLLFTTESRIVPGSGERQASVKVTGDVLLVGRDGKTSTLIGHVDFESHACTGNPVMAFLSRYGSPAIERQPLANPGWSHPTTQTLRAPNQSWSYAAVSADSNPIHVSSVVARYAGLDETVVHGMHTSAIVRRTVEWMIGDADRLRFNSWKAAFEGIVRHKDPLRIEMQHIAMQDGFMVLKVEVFNDETGLLVLSAEAMVEQLATAYVFCGQGSQEKGMGMSLYNTSPDARACWDNAERYLKQEFGFSLLHIVRDNPTTLTIGFGGKRGRQVRSNYLALTKHYYSLDGGTATRCVVRDLTSSSTQHVFKCNNGLLHSTDFSQLAIVIMELAEYQHLKGLGIVKKNTKFAGHSLGEFAALMASTSFFPIESLLPTLFYRGLTMQDCLPRNAQGNTGYSMMAVDPSRIGKAFNEQCLQSLVREIGQRSKLLLEIVNYNIKSQQYVCSGHVKALFLLGRMCDDLSTVPSPHLLTPESLHTILDRHISVLDLVLEQVRLERGKATIPLHGIEIPFHSSMLRTEIDDIRERLLERVKVEDVVPEELVDRWIPNVTGRPFALDRDYIQHVQDVTGSSQLRTLVAGTA